MAAIITDQHGRPSFSWGVLAPHQGPKLPALIAIDCPNCGGSGYLERDHNTMSVCEPCDGWGRVEVCGGCHETPNALDECKCKPGGL